MSPEVKLPVPGSESLRTALKRLVIVIIFGVAFGYIESAIVVYLRAIFHPDGFTFPLVDFGIGPLWKKLLLVEIGREAATLVLILTSSLLFGRNRRQRFAYFLIIFSIWDIFYYVWLKVLINWPESIMDWDILFLIPLIWASSVLAPVLISLTLFAFAVTILICEAYRFYISASFFDWLGFILAALIVVTSFCIAGLHINEPHFKAHFNWLLFTIGYALAIALFIRCVLKSKPSATFES